MMGMPDGFSAAARGRVNARRNLLEINLTLRPSSLVPRAGEGTWAGPWAMKAVGRADSNDDGRAAHTRTTRGLRTR